MMRPTKARSWFDVMATRVARHTGHPLTFAVAALFIIGWLITGPIFRFSDTWQLVVNTATTVVTFLMVFLIQSTQNRDGEAIQVKLDELIRATKGAHNALIDLEELEERELDLIRSRYVRLARAARDQLRKGEADTDSPDIGGSNELPER